MPFGRNRRELSFERRAGHEQGSVVMQTVKADFEAGLSFDVMGKQYNCSGSHVRNYLTRHGIDPRRSGNPKSGGTPALTDEEKQRVLITGLRALDGRADLEVH